MAKKNIESLSFLEDLCWLLESKKNLNFSDVAKTINEIKNVSDEKLNRNTQNEVIKLQEDIIGILPKMLVDTTLFKTNKSLSQFADEVLKIEIKNWEKRSRNEMIGVIICQIQDSGAKLKGVSAYLLENILQNKDEFVKIQKERENRNDQFKWNDAIHEIVGRINE